jgi:hypothetical protein
MAASRNFEVEATLEPLKLDLWCMIMDLKRLDIDILINCNWFVTRWQYTFTHKHYIEQHKYKLIW